MHSRVFTAYMLLFTTQLIFKINVLRRRSSILDNSFSGGHAYLQRLCLTNYVTSVAYVHGTATFLSSFFMS